MDKKRSRLELEQSRRDLLAKKEEKENQLADLKGKVDQMSSDIDRVSRSFARLEQHVTSHKFASLHCTNIYSISAFL